MLSDFPWTSCSGVSGNTWAKEKDMGGVESLCLGEAGAAATGERTGGLENGWQRGTGARDRPSLTPVMPDRCLCPIAVSARSLSLPDRCLCPIAVSASIARLLSAVYFYWHGSLGSLPGLMWVGDGTNSTCTTGSLQGVADHHHLPPPLPNSPALSLHFMPRALT